MGLGKSFRKAWKKSLGWADDDWVKQAAIVSAVGALTGGIGAGATAGVLSAEAGAGIGALAGATVGGLQGYQSHQQEKALKAQIASAEKIAEMQNSLAAVSAAPAPSTVTEKASISEQSEATRKARAFRLSNSVRSSTLGGGFGNKKKTLG